MEKIIIPCGEYNCDLEWKIDKDGLWIMDNIAISLEDLTKMVAKEKKGRIGIVSWGFIVLMFWFVLWFGYRVVVSMERGLLG